RNGVLGGLVRPHESAAAEKPALRGGVDDASPFALLEHARRERADAVDDAKDVHLEAPAPVAHRAFPALAVDQHTGIVEKQIDLAMAGEDLVGQLLDGLLVPNIDDPGLDRLPAGATDLFQP